MTERVKFTQVSRVICPKTGIHYMDALDENGVHWMATMEKLLSHREWCEE